MNGGYVVFSDESSFCLRMTDDPSTYLTKTLKEAACSVYSAGKYGTHYGFYGVEDTGTIIVGYV